MALDDLLPDPVEADQDLAPEDEIDLGEYDLALVEARIDLGVELPEPDDLEDEDAVDYTAPENY